METYLKEAAALSAENANKHSHKKGRYHSSMWHYYMGRFCAFRETLKYLSGHSREKEGEDAIF